MGSRGQEAAAWGVLTAGQGCQRPRVWGSDSTLCRQPGRRGGDLCRERWGQMWCGWRCASPQQGLLLPRPLASDEQVWADSPRQAGSRSWWPRVEGSPVGFLAADVCGHGREPPWLEGSQSWAPHRRGSLPTAGPAAGLDPALPAHCPPEAQGSRGRPGLGAGRGCRAALTPAAAGVRGALQHGPGAAAAEAEGLPRRLPALPAHPVHPRVAGRAPMHRGPLGVHEPLPLHRAAGAAAGRRMRAAVGQGRGRGPPAAQGSVGGTVLLRWAWLGAQRCACPLCRTRPSHACSSCSGPSAFGTWWWSTAATR